MSHLVKKNDYEKVVRSIAERLGADICPVIYIAHLRMSCAPFIANIFHGDDSKPLSRVMTAASVWFPRSLRYGLSDAKLQVFLAHGRRVHSELKVAPDQLEYALAVLALSLQNWIQDNTTIKLSQHQAQSLLAYFAELGKVMEIPTNCNSFEDYELKCIEFEQHFPSFQANRAILVQEGSKFVRDTSSFQYRLIAFFLYRISVPAHVSKLMGIYRPNRIFASVIRSLFRVRWQLADLGAGLRQLGSRRMAGRQRQRTS